MIVDESHRHAGHAGARPEGETHFTVTIVSAAFAGLNRVARQRLVYETLADELATRVHALSLTTLAPTRIGLTRASHNRYDGMQPYNFFHAITRMQLQLSGSRL